MRELVLKMSMSVDGFVSDLDGRNGWMFGTDQEAKAWSVEFLWNASLHIMGSRTFHGMAAWWPTSTDQFAAPMKQIPKAVFSRQGPAILANATRRPRRLRCKPARRAGRRPMWRAVTSRRKSPG
ncbi:dihydrofolate reductase family protein [Aminobacter sp. NyZ550]|uniref:dihydrofolate reductase family protein n=1 Tax=Aminobacter sp. NyZ550 TaxID=2979870 RepID=UPI0021D5AF12|nr:dihydrofolate reductase family protein [Aminobacter sp. NyZ550]WAX95754.1 dihydrofolate reductase family protein [Aminobacter sp. NyZ550]